MQDMIDPGTVQVVGGSPDVRDWPITAALTRLEFLPTDVRVDFTKRDGRGRWPDVVPPGWDGPIQWTLWAVIKVDGQWFTTGCIEFWNDREGVGGPFSAARQDWYYFVPEMHHQPGPGEQVGFFVAAGDQRRKDVRSVIERSNIVLLTVPPGDRGVFTFDGTIPDPAPGPDPGPVPAPLPASDILALLTRIANAAEELVRLATP